MTISIGEKIPNISVYMPTVSGSKSIDTIELFENKKVVLFGLPGAFTPTCSKKHLPGYITSSDQLTEKGVNSIICVSVNDAFVMGAWGKDQGVEEKVIMVSDGTARFASALGLAVDEGDDFGIRCQRFSMLVNNGIVEILNLESEGGYHITSAEHLLTQL